MMATPERARRTSSVPTCPLTPPFVMLAGLARSGTTWLGKLFESMKDAGLWDTTAVIVSADHGDAFGEHNQWRHAFELWNVLTHVPLFFHVPGAEAKRIEATRSHIDLAPTVLDLMGLPKEPRFRGETLVPEMFGAIANPKPILLDLPADTENPRRRALIHGDYKLLVFNAGYRRLLYNLKADPEEKRRLNKKEPEKLAEMNALFDEEWKKLDVVKAYGGVKLKDNTYATGPSK